jgi:hypothetical protein
MKWLQIVTAMIGLGLLASCETTNVSGRGNQEAKRLAAIERHREQAPLPEDQANLWSAHRNILDRDTNPLRAY